MRRTKEDAEMTRQLLLDAALKLFVRKGYADTKLADVAREVGVTSGAIYWHFGSKQKMLIAMIERMVSPYLENINSIINAGLLPYEKIGTLATFMLEKLSNDEKFKDQYRLREMILNNNGILGDLEHHFGGQFRRFQLQIHQIIKTGQDDGGIRNDVPPETITTFFFRFLASFSDWATSSVMERLGNWNHRQMAELFMSAIKG
jgi:TetR/AcrR family acrAB operon transcriptional repressor